METSIYGYFASRQKIQHPGYWLFGPIISWEMFDSAILNSRRKPTFGLL